MEARDVAGGASVSHMTTLTPLELYPAAAMIEPLDVTYVTSLQSLRGTAGFIRKQKMETIAKA